MLETSCVLQFGVDRISLCYNVVWIELLCAIIWFGQNSVVLYTWLGQNFVNLQSGSDSKLGAVGCLRSSLDQILLVPKFLRGL